MRTICWKNQIQHIIDTHTFLWFVKGSQQLPDSVRRLIESPTDSTQISIASFWEIGIKAGLGKLPLTTGLLGLEAIAARQSIEILPITVQAILTVQRMPLHHKDPFDRIIAATSLVTGSILLSADTIFDVYGVPRIWQVDQVYDRAAIDEQFDEVGGNAGGVQPVFAAGGAGADPGG